ncbi:MAG: fused MFS/spermidine synthase [Firmicutes bacterium]|nr:fused MFS/spermidine synthase [Alicyclobacillaceae bacterium]MCL6497229.1 fused MFS/spermidine synthase [Bacillota bacterium]
MQGTAEGGARGQGRRRSAWLKGLVTVTGAGVMAVEFAAERLLAPFFGNSELVWGLLIGLILLGLSLGYQWGGRLADRHPDPRWLGGVVLASGVWTAALPSAAEPLLRVTAQGLLATPAGLVVAALVGVAVLFVPPVVALGAVSPYAVRLSVSRVADSGETAGALYAWATLGSLLGTFVPVFWTIPSFGVRATLWGTGAVLIAAGASCAGLPWAFLALAVPLGLAHAAPAWLKPMPGLLAEVETPYQFAEVWRYGAGGVALSVNDGAGIQSVWTPSPLTGLYYDAFVVLPFLFPPGRPISALVLGMGAGTIPTLFFRDVDPVRAAPVRVTGVEIDPVLTALGRRYFHLVPEAATVVHEDARVYLETHAQRFDLIVVDAYSNEIYIPFTLTTRQFFELVAAHLMPGGLLAMNVNAVDPRAPLLRDLERTLETVFPWVGVARAPGAYNYLVVAAFHPFPAPDPASLPRTLRPPARLVAATWHRAHPGPGLVFTDNRAPVETLTNQMILSRLLPALRASAGGQ